MTKNHKYNACDKSTPLKNTGNSSLNLYAISYNETSCVVYPKLIKGAAITKGAIGSHDGNQFFDKAKR